MPELPTLVFVPGSWHKPTCYNKVMKPLREKYGFICNGVTLASASDNPEATFKEDVDATRTTITTETSQGRNVIVIAHSYGGMVGNSAIKYLTKPKDGGAQGSSPTSALSTGHVVGLVLIASGFTFTGLAFMDPFLGIPPPSWRVNKETGFAELVAPPRDFFYHDLPKDEAEEAVAQLTPQSLKSLFEGGEYSYAGWQDVPVWYVGTIEDRGLPVVVQRMQVGMAREMGATVEHKELRSSHSPFLSQPSEVVKILVDAVTSFTGQAVEEARLADKLDNDIAIPTPRIWQPLTWFKFGLPLVVGRIIGRGILVSRWIGKLWRSSRN